MSILDDILEDEEMLSRAVNHFTYAPLRNSKRNGLSARQAKAATDLNYQISDLCICFFTQNYNKESLEDTNRRMKEDYWDRVPRYPKPTIMFDSMEQAAEVAEYVLTLPFPTTVSKMYELFEHVTTGKLKFLSDYPIDNSSIGIQVKSIKVCTAKEEL